MNYIEYVLHFTGLTTRPTKKWDKKWVNTKYGAITVIQKTEIV